MSLKKNIIGLGVAQLFNYLLPFIQFPYLTRVLGTEYFGLIMYACSIIVMLQVITDYGLEIYLTKKITDRNIGNKHIGKYLTQSFFLKICLILFISPLFLLVYINTKFENYPMATIFIYLTVIVNAFNPLWIYQGLEKTYVYARVVILFKIISLFFVFIFVKNESDYVLYLILFFLNSFFVNFVLYFWVFFKIKVTPKKIKKIEIVELVKGSFEYFISRAGATLYVTGCSVFLGTFSSLQQVALYTSAEKLYIAGCGVFAPVITAFIPYMNRTKNYKLFYKVTFFVFILSLVGVIIGIYFGGDIIKIIFGESLILAKNTLNILLLALVFNIMGMMFGYPALMPIGLVKHANLSVIFSGLIQLVLFISIILINIPLTSFNVAITFLISTIFTFLYRLLFFVKYKNITIKAK
ncbi:oligosaccharide flippase family protein [Photobacterium damselae]|uniref:oligosaccharide flippase family protein n=1 Tax=Photobacterium damselae TaxID=38293 RepID=UPI0013023E48|nr:oligosaccharide flippase family protein [Photobacterium damselae]